MSHGLGVKESDLGKKTFVETLSVVIIEGFCRNFSRWWCCRARRDRVGVTGGGRLAVVLIVNGLFASLVHWLERESALRATESNFKSKVKSNFKVKFKRTAAHSENFTHCGWPH